MGKTQANSILNSINWIYIINEQKGKASTSCPFKLSFLNKSRSIERKLIPPLWGRPRVTYESQRFNSIPWWLSWEQQNVTTFHTAALTLLWPSRGSLTLTEITSFSHHRYFFQALMWARWETAVASAGAICPVISPGRVS